jgi:hypothetical protein
VYRRQPLAVAGAFIPGPPANYDDKEYEDRRRRDRVEDNNDRLAR